MIGKTKEIIKRYKKTSIITALLIVGVVIFVATRNGTPIAENVVRAQIGTIKQEVTATGRVKPAQTVDLSFDRSGKAVAVAVKAGDRVASGQLLAQLDSSELLAQRQRELAGITAAAQRLNQTATATDGSQVSSSDTAIAVSKSLKVAIDSMVDFTTIQYAYFDSHSGESNEIANTKEEIMKTIYDQRQLGRVGAWYFLPLDTGLKAEVEAAEKNPENANYDSLILKVRAALLQTKNGLELIHARLSGTSNVKAADLTMIKTDIDLVIGQLSSLTTEKKTIVSQGFDVEIAKAQLDQARANLALIDAQIAKNSLRSPFAGIITDVNIERGQVVAGGPSISMIGTGKYEVEVNVSEADIAKIKVGNSAIITLDAYGSDQKFDAKITNIDPAANVAEGVATYRVILQFDKQDERLLPGLTADIDIQTNQKENVLYVPSRDIITKNGKKYVKVLVSTESPDLDPRFANLSAASETKTEKVYEIEVQTGLRGSDGKIEIVSGLKEGDQIISD